MSNIPELDFTFTTDKKEWKQLENDGWDFYLFSFNSQEKLVRHFRRVKIK